MCSGGGSSWDWNAARFRSAELRAGAEAQVDWYEAWAILSGERVKLQVFEMRSMASGAAFHRAYTHATQQAFLEAHEHAFRYFGGVFRVLRYDNLKSAVKKVLRGSRREETSRFIAFRSHWRYQSEFCNPARGNEKGGVEGEGGYFRRNHWVPLPEVRDLDALNTWLERCCREDHRRVISGRSQRVGAAMLEEQAHLLPLAGEPFDLADTSFPTVDGLRCVRVRTNRYSVPLTPGTKVEARVSADHVELWHEGKRVARHERCYQPSAADPRSGTLSRCAAAQAWRTGRFDAAGAVAAGRPLAGVLRSAMAGS